MLNPTIYFVFAFKLLFMTIIHFSLKYEFSAALHLMGWPAQYTDWSASASQPNPNVGPAMMYKKSLSAESMVSSQDGNFWERGQ